VDARPARDRLAVWTYDDDGEEIPCGDPSVTDAERASAGRPGSGRNACSGLAFPAAIRNGSADMTPCAGTRNSPPPWPGCWRRH